MFQIFIAICGQNSKFDFLVCVFVTIKVNNKQSIILFAKQKLLKYSKIIGKVVSTFKYLLNQFNCFAISKIAMAPHIESKGSFK